MSRTTTTIAALTAVAALALPAVASAHVTMNPNTSTAGAFTKLDVRVPNEQSNASTVKLQLQFPDGFAFASYEPRADWRVKVTRAKLATPVQTDDGPITEGVKTITWTGSGSGLGRIGARPVHGLPAVRADPGERAGKTLQFKAIQTYSNGDVVRWIGAADSEHPAPHVTVTAAAAGSSGSAVPAAAGRTGAPGRRRRQRHHRRHRAHRRRHRPRRRRGGARHHPAPAPQRVRAGRMRRAGTAAALAAAAAMLALCAGTAWGHTEVARFVPGKGATVSTPVKVVGVRFEGPVVTGLLTLTTASGRTITPREQGVVSRDTYLRMVLRVTAGRGVVSRHLAGAVRGRAPQAGHLDLPGRARRRR